MMKVLPPILLIAIFSLLMANNSFSQNKEADSLLHLLATTKQDSSIINLHLQLANLYLDEETGKSLGHAQSALQVAEKIDNRFLAARCHHQIGVCHDYLGNLDSCLYELDTAAALFKLINNTEKLANVTSDKALAYYVRGNFELALRNHFTALEIRKKNGNKNFIAKSLNNIGLLYRSKKDYPNAISYYRQSMAIKEEVKDEQGMVNTLINISSAYNSENKFDSTYFYAFKAMQLAEKIHADKDIYGAQVNMGVALVGMKKMDEAQTLFYAIEKKALLHNDKSVLGTLYEGLGNIFFERKIYPMAQQYYLQGLEVAKKAHRKERIEVFYRKLSENLRQQQQYVKAFIYTDSAAIVSHQLLNEENLRQLNEMAAVYESLEKEKKISALHAENLFSAMDAADRKKERNYFIAATALFLMLAVLAWFAFTANKKKKEQLAAQKQLIEKSLQEKEILLREIHHRVKNNLQVVSSLLSLQSNYITDEHALQAVKESRNRVQSMSLIHQNLYQEDNLTGIEIHDYINKLCDNLFHSYNIHVDKIKLLKELQPLNLDVDIVVPLGLILNELITNSLKYAFTDGREGTIKIILKEENNTLKLGVYDNGIGTQLKEKLKEEYAFGYKMINAFLQKLKGEMKIYSDNGTRVDIEIKNYKPV
jgi:two-component sensor histidine kinase